LTKGGSDVNSHERNLPDAPITNQTNNASVPPT